MLSRLSACGLIALAIGSGTFSFVRMTEGQPPPRGISTEAVVEEWYDGDTCVVTLKLQCRVRLLDCWAPEVTGKQKPAGLLSKAKARKLVPEGSTIRLFLPTTGRLQDSLTFGRALGTIWYREADGEWKNVSEEMVAAGFATREKVR
mgnify:CR=1 FL=1